MSVAKMSKVTLVGLRDEQIEIVSYLANVGALQIEENKRRDEDFKELAKRQTQEKKNDLKDLHYYSEIRSGLRENNLLKHSVEFIPPRDADNLTMASWTQDKSETELRDYFFERMNTFALADADIIGGTEELSDEALIRLKQTSQSFNVKAEQEPLTTLAENYTNLLDSIIKKANSLSNGEGGPKDGEVSNNDYLEAAFEQKDIISQAVKFINLQDKIEDRQQKIRAINENIFALEAGDYESLSEELSGVNLEETPEEKAEYLLKFTDRITQLEAEITGLETDLLEPASYWHKFETLHDFYEIQANKLREMGKFSYSDYLFVLNAYIPYALAADFVSDIEAKYAVSCELVEAGVEEDYPILLQNNALVRPFESVIEMYSMPKPGYDLDPSALTGIFYVFFFGMMLGDVGYGALLAIACGVALWGLKVKGGSRSLISMLFGSGLVAIPFGFMFGSFFGNLLTQVTDGAVNFDPILFSPLEEPVLMMAMSIGFGFVHLFAGVFLEMFIKIKRGNWYQAVFKDLPWFFIIVGLLLWALLGQDWGIWLVIGALSVLILLGGQKKGKNIFAGIFSGVANLVDVTDWLSDALSYTRILALSLSTSVIAMVVNILAMIVGYNGIFQIIFFVVIMIFGHILNLVISGLSGYVHTLRLQFVEFFGKFYTGGGSKFQPLNYESKYTRVTDIEDEQQKIATGAFKRVKPELVQVTEDEL